MRSKLILGAASAMVLAGGGPAAAKRGPTMSRYSSVGRRSAGRVAVVASLLLAGLVWSLGPAHAARLGQTTPYDPRMFGFAGLSTVTVPPGVVTFDTQTGGISVGGSPLRRPGPAGVQGGIGVAFNVGTSHATAFVAQSWTFSADSVTSYVGAAPLAVLAMGDETVAGTLTADGAGGPGGSAASSQGPGGQGPGGGSGGSCTVPGTGGSGGGGGFGGSGGSGGISGSNPGALGGAPYGAADQSSEVLPGSGGGGAVSCPTPSPKPVPGGAGGGGLVLTALGALHVSGSITAKGSSPGSTPTDQPGSGGGSGGSIVLITPNLTLDPTALISVAGGAGGDTTQQYSGGGRGGGGGGGGGGRIAIVSNQPAGLLSADTAARGGLGGSNTLGGPANPGAQGGTGTVFERPYQDAASPTFSTQASTGGHPGDPVFDTATLSGGSSPSGSITFTLFGPGNDTCAGTPTFTSTKTVSGNGTYTSDSFTPASSGTYHWLASYSGDINNYYSAAAANCSDPAESVTVNPISTTTGLGSSANPSTMGQAVTFTATVSPGSGSGTATPTGSVQFKDNGANLGSPQPLVGTGQASLTTSSLAVGNHTIEADYGGDTVFATSTATLTQAVTADAPLTISRIGAVANDRREAAAGVTFTDADPLGTLTQYSATIDWGDLSPAMPASVARNPIGPGFVAGCLHHYLAAGTYTVTVTVHDTGGAVMIRSTTVIVPAGRG